MYMKKWLLILWVLAFHFPVNGQNTVPLSEIIKKRPVPIHYVHDYANAISETQEQVLNEKLRRFDDSTSVQIAVLLVNSLEGRKIEEVGLEIGRTWGVGNKGMDNGVVVIASIQDRKIRIETGSDVERYVTDYRASEIIDNSIKPNFRQQLYYEGLDHATSDIIASVQGKYTPPKNYHKNKRGAPGGFIQLMVMMFIIFIIIAIISKKGGGNGGMLSRRGYRDWTPPIITNWGGGGSSGGGGGGGGWSGGFGGGGFSGGGASGDW